MYFKVHLVHYLYRSGRTPCDGGTKSQIYCQGCVCALLWAIKLGLTKVGNQAKPLKYFEKSCILYQFRADVQIYGHRSRYTADNDAAETDVFTQKCQVAV